MHRGRAETAPRRGLTRFGAASSQSSNKLWLECGPRGTLWQPPDISGAAAKKKWEVLARAIPPKGRANEARPLINLPKPEDFDPGHFPYPLASSGGHARIF